MSSLRSCFSPVFSPFSSSSFSFVHDTINEDLQKSGESENWFSCSLSSNVGNPSWSSRGGRSSTLSMSKLRPKLCKENNNRISKAQRDRTGNIERRGEIDGENRWGLQICGAHLQMTKMDPIKSGNLPKQTLFLLSCSNLFLISVLFWDGMWMRPQICGPELRSSFR